MLEQIAAIKLIALVGYAILIFVLVRSKVAFGLKLHFALYLFGLGSWQLTSFIITIARDPGTAVILYNLQLGAACLQSIIFMPLARVFLGVRRFRGPSIAAYILAAVTCTASILQTAIRTVTVGQAGYFVPKLDAAVYLISLIIYLFWGFGVFMLVAGFRRERIKLQRNRIAYVLVGAIIVIIGTVTNFTPLQAYPVDTICTLVNALLVAYAVTRYRLIDTGTALRRSLAILAILAVGIGGYVVCSFGAGLLLRPTAAKEVSLSGLAGFIVLIALTLVLGWKSVRPLIDRIAGRRSGNYDRVLERFTQTTRSLLDVEKLKALFVSSATDAVGTERGCLLFADGVSQGYTAGTIYGTWPTEMHELRLMTTDDFVRALKDHKHPLWEQELLVDPGLDYLRPLCEPFFKATGTSVAIPVIQEESVVGILCLGNRTSDTLYGTDDLRFLATLANVAASSIAVALNYREIERQLSIQTFLFVLSESLVRYAGSEEAIRSAIRVLQSFLGAEECFVLTYARTGEVRVHSTRELTPLLERRLAETARAFAAGATGVEPIDQRETGDESRLLASLSYLPLISGGEWIGLLALSGRGRENGGTDSTALSGAFRAILSQGLLAIRHVAELRALKEYNDNVLMSVSTSGEMLLVIDEHGTVLRTNSAVDALGYREADLRGRSLRDFVDRELSGAALETFLGTAATRVVQNIEMQALARSGRRVPVLVSSAFIEGNQAQEIVVTVRDISRLREAERGRDESERRYQSLFESVLDAVIAFDDTGLLVDINPAGREVFGISGERRSEWNLPRDFILQPDRFEQLKAELSRQGSIRDFEMQLRTPQGGPRVALFTGSMGERSPGGHRIIHGILRDVTEQRALQHQLLQSQKMESLGTLAGGIAHDFNNILTVTLGYTLLIRREIDDREAVLEHLDVVESSARRAADLTRRLLSFARAGVTDRKPVRVNDLVLDAVQLLRRTFDRSIEIRTKLAPDLPFVNGDQGQIHQILINLCVNARDAMPKGGVLTLRTRAEIDASARDTLTAQGHGDVVLEVCDTGTGIARELMTKIFDPFFTTKGPGEGTGLGLSIVYGIVKQHRGRVEVASIPGQGTTFTVRFPASEESAAGPGAAAETHDEPRGRETIMVVDDEPDLRELMRISLAERGYTVIEAADGLDAIDAYQAHGYAVDLVVIDLIMPNLGGRETYLKLKEMNPHVKAVFATGYGTDDQARELMTTGVLGIIRKPYEMSDVEASIRRFLDLSAT
jgi:two-component system, cell cycle sensor histidine kinase and response regulator CckA